MSASASALIYVTFQYHVFKVFEAIRLELQVVSAQWGPDFLCIVQLCSATDKSCFWIGQISLKWEQF